MSLVGAITRVGALLLAIAMVGCSSDDDNVLGVGGSAATTSTGGSTSPATTTAVTATGGSSSEVGGSSSIDAGGTSAVVTQAAGGSATTGGTSSTVVATGGVGNATGGAPATGGASVVATTTPATYGISGTVTGLLGSGLMLKLNAGTPIPIVADGAFSFTTKLPAGSNVSVTVATQPTNPQQTCTVSAAGTVASLTSNVSNVVVTCATTAFTVGGTITGLAGSGLTLQNNNGPDLVVAANGTSFVFPAAVAIGQSYAVSIKAQPTAPTQVCSLSSATGTIATSNVTSVAINCVTSSFSIAGTVSGLQGTGLVIRSTGATDQAILADGPYTFNASVLSGTSYSVTVATQPIGPAQTCAVTGGTGKVGAANVSVVITCAINKYLVGGTATGLSGSGLTLQNNGADDLVVTGTPFHFATGIEVGGAYAVTITQQPTNPTQNCTVADGTGSGSITDADITTVQISCSTLSYFVGGTVTGLTGTGLVLTNNAADDKTIDAVGNFMFATSALSGTNYSVKVKTQPTTGVCSIAAGYGIIGSSDVSTIAVNCADQAHSVSGTVTGLLGSGLKLSLNGNAPQAVTADGPVSFTDPVANGSAYAVTVTQQPTVPSQNCVVTNDSGTMGTADITNVVVTCTTKAYALSGTITGLLGSVVLKDSMDEPLTVTHSGTGTDSFSFVTPVLSGKSTDVTVVTPPTVPVQTCVVNTAPGGIIVDAPVTNIQITCTTTPFKVSATVTGLIGTLVLGNNTTDPLSFTADGTLPFGTLVDSGAGYTVTVTTQPTNQTCVFAGGAASAPGTVTNADVVVPVTCTTNGHYVGGTIAGFAGTITLQDNNGDDLTVTTPGSFQFHAPVAVGAGYSVTVKTSPATQITCGVIGGKGTMGTADVSTVKVYCPGYDFTSGIEYWQIQSDQAAVSGPTIVPTQITTDGSPDLGALSSTLPLTATCPSWLNIVVIPSGTAFLNTTGMTKMSAWIKIVGQYPTSDGSGIVQLYANDNVSYTMWHAPYSGFQAIGLGVWKQLTFDLTTTTTIDKTNIKAFGLNFWFGSATCQPTTILVDSVTFE